MPPSPLNSASPRPPPQAFPALNPEWGQAETPQPPQRGEEARPRGSRVTSGHCMENAAQIRAGTWTIWQTLSRWEVER